MSKERMTTKNDARLADAAISLANQFIVSELHETPEIPNSQKDQLYGNYKQVFEAVANTMTHGKEDIRGLFRIARKIRAINERV